jgi:hypothetical protein
LVILLLVATIGSYAPSVRNGFVWDDTALVLRDPLIRSWRLIPEGFNHYLFVDATPSDFYRPLQRLTYTLEYAFFTANPKPFHLTSILLHSGAAIALMLFGEALFCTFGLARSRARWLAFIAALVWGIHPVHSSAVVYVAGRADPLAALFGFGGGWLAIQSMGRQKTMAVACLLGAGVAFLASALSKESGLIYPALMIVVAISLRHWRWCRGLILVALFVCVTYVSLRWPAEHNPPPPAESGAPLSSRPITMARAVAEYTGLLLLPINLHMERDVDVRFTHNLYADSSAAAAREVQTLIGIILAAGLVRWLLWTRGRHQAVFALLVCGILAYIPVSGIIRLNAPVAEHWIYLPSAFLFLAVALQLSNLKWQSPRPVLVRTGAAALGIWMLFLGGRTFARTFDWRDQRTFLERTIAAGGRSARMLINLGAVESQANRLEIARQRLTDALKIEPDQPFGLIELAVVEIKRKDFPAARALLGEALRHPLVAAQAQELLAVVENKENGRANLLRLRLAAHTGVSNWLIEKRYIKVLAETGATDAAIHELQTCLQTQWYRAESWQLLAQLLARSGRQDAATEALAVAHSYDVHLSARPAVL